MLVMLGLDRYDPINGQIAELKYPCRRLTIMLGGANITILSSSPYASADTIVPKSYESEPRL
jgi:hypothetical protein